LTERSAANLPKPHHIVTTTTHPILFITKTTTTMKKALALFCLIFLSFTTTIAQTALFEVKWFSSNVSYTALIVLDGQENCYARVLYNKNGNRTVVEERLTFKSQSLINGETLVSLDGNNVKAIFGSAENYNADKFSFQQNEQGEIDNFKVGDNTTPLAKASSFKKLDAIERSNLKQFYNELDAEYTRMFKLYGTNESSNASTTRDANAEKQTQKETTTTTSNNNTSNNNNTTTASGNSIMFQNNTGKKIFIAICVLDRANGWTSFGWYKVEKYGSYIHDLGSYMGTAYVHAQDESLIPGTWGSGYSLCVDPVNSFRIFNADKVNCQKKRQFSSLRINRGVNRYTFNP
jgi:hypothetical protein